ncbi:hypothetical protein LguiB_022208 [Lonicera macranthoides]
MTQESRMCLGLHMRCFLIKKWVDFLIPHLGSSHENLVFLPLPPMTDHHVYPYNACIKRIK